MNSTYNDPLDKQQSDLHGKPQPPPKRSKYHGILTEIRNIFILILFIVVIRSSILGFYVVPTGSMLPSVKLQDRLLANFLAYGLILPLGEKQVLSWGSPQRGDIIMFKSPTPEGVTFVKRVVGIGGDTISFSDSVLHINGKPMGEVELTDRSVLDDMGGEPPTDKKLYLESGLSAEPHYILKAINGGVSSGKGHQWFVPEGKIFVMGDNRDGSNDSRFWGFVDANKVYGRAERVFFSTIPGPGLLPQFRFDRFFMDLK